MPASDETLIELNTRLVAEAEARTKTLNLLLAGIGSQGENIAALTKVVHDITDQVEDRPTKTEANRKLLIAVIFVVVLQLFQTVPLIAIAVWNRTTLTTIQDYNDPNSDVRKEADTRTAALLDNFARELECRIQRLVQRQPPLAAGETCLKAVPPG